jgi:acyl carrier protein
MEEKILNVLRTVLEDPTIGADCSQENSENWDSLRHLTVCFELEGAFNVQFEPNEMEAMKSVDDIKRILAGKLN